MEKRSRHAVKNDAFFGKWVLMERRTVLTISFIRVHYLTGDDSLVGFNESEGDEYV